MAIVEQDGKCENREGRWLREGKPSPLDVRRILASYNIQVIDSIALTNADLQFALHKPTTSYSQLGTAFLLIEW